MAVTKKLIGKVPIKEMEQAINDFIEDVKNREAVLTDTFSYEDNPEWIKVIVDAEGKVLAGIKADGSVYIGRFENENSNIQEALEELKNKIGALDGVFSVIDSVDGMLEITIDAEGKIISYRKKDGTKVEHSLEVEHFSLTKDGMTEFQQALKDAGFNPGGTGDWSDYVSNDGDDPLHLPTPNCAICNITNESNNVKPPVTKTDNIVATLEYYDKFGNYFKKPIIMNAQGNSSLSFIKKNIAIDLFDTSQYNSKGVLGKGDAFALKFGKWVSQDGFHLKAYYTDFFKGMCVIGYKLYIEQMDTLGIMRNRTYKTTFTDAYTESGDGYESMPSSLRKNLDTGARCVPDGFPCIVYLNGEFYGVYSWQLKKHRDNYWMKKAEKKSIHLDGIGEISDTSLWNGTIKWGLIEVRNPKDLYNQSGGEYTEGNELIDDTIDGEPNENYDSSDKTAVNTKYVKDAIKNLSLYQQEIKKMQSENNDEDTIKKRLEEMFDIDSIIEYLLVCNILGNADAFAKNWQWTTWDAKKWAVNPYDMDSLFGHGAIGTRNGAFREWILGDGTDTPVQFVLKYYMKELKARWKYLRDCGLYTSEHICELINDWTDRIGEDNFNKEYEKWPESPCNRPNNINEEYWKLYPYTNDEAVEYSPETSYVAGNMVYYGKSQRYYFSCIKPCINEAPIKKFYNEYPYELGTFDSVYRVKKWLDRQIKFLDSKFEYNV